MTNVRPGVLKVTQTHIHIHTHTGVCDSQSTPGQSEKTVQGAATPSASSRLPRPPRLMNFDTILTNISTDSHDISTLPVYR